MKANVFILLFVFYSIECRKVYKPLDKNANIDFINMENGGARPGPNQQSVVPPPKTPIGPLQPSNQPKQTQGTNPSKPETVTTIKPAPITVPPKPTQPQTVPQTIPSKPQVPNQIKPAPINPPPAVNPITTPGYGTVKQLVNFYDSQGKASPIRPYSYSQAVKQG